MGELFRAPFVKQAPRDFVSRFPVSVVKGGVRLFHFETTLNCVQWLLNFSRQMTHWPWCLSGENSNTLASFRDGIDCEQREFKFLDCFHDDNSVSTGADVHAMALY